MKFRFSGRNLFQESKIDPSARKAFSSPIFLLQDAVLQNLFVDMVPRIY
jgi:hypothetical protein